MFVKIDEKTALQLAAKGKEVLVMVPAGTDSGWEGMMPSTLGHMLEGCMFFRKEPAMESGQMVGQVGPTGTHEIQPAKLPAVEKKRKPKKVDVGRIKALHNAGWSAARIAEDLRISDRTVYVYLQKIKEEQNGAIDSETSKRD